MSKPNLGLIRDEILRQIERRGVGRTICPSEVARAFSDNEAVWRALMPAVRQVALELANDGKLTITKKGLPVTGSYITGPIRLGMLQT